MVLHQSIRKKYSGEIIILAPIIRQKKGTYEKLLEELNKKGKTVIMVTHEPDIAAHAKRAIRIKDGRIEQ